MGRYPKIVSIAICLLFTLCISNAIASEGKATERKMIASIFVKSDAIYWKPNVDFAKLALTVTGPYDTVIKKTITPEEELFITANENKDSKLPNGGYRYELVVYPKIDIKTKEKLRAARDTNTKRLIKKLKMSGKLSHRAVSQTGYFTIAEGAFVNPETVEETGQTNN